MPSFPGNQVQCQQTILSTIGQGSQVKDAVILGGVAANSFTWLPSASAAKFVAVVVETEATAQQIAFNFTVASGNFDVGIYDAGSNLLVSSGSTAVATGLTVVNIADTVLVPGTYFIAMSVDNITASILSSRVSSIALPDFTRGMGRMQALSTFPLPSTVSMTRPTDLTIPIIAVTLTANPI